MTKKSDMASRYAAAHARREQRKRQVPTREFLPLAEEHFDAGQPAMAGIGSLGRNAATAARSTSRLAPIDYSYLRADLLRTAILAAILFAGMIILSFIIH